MVAAAVAVDRRGGSAGPGRCTRYTETGACWAERGTAPHPAAAEKRVADPALEGTVGSGTPAVETLAGRMTVQDL